MKKQLTQAGLIITALLFVGIFAYLVIPAQLEHFDIIGGFAAGFVNNYSSAYSMDAILCWVVLAIWIIYESPKVKYAWVCLLLGLMPGVVVGFALYLILRMRQGLG